MSAPLPAVHAVPTGLSFSLIGGLTKRPQCPSCHKRVYDARVDFGDGKQTNLVITADSEKKALKIIQGLGLQFATMSADDFYRMRNKGMTQGTFMRVAVTKNRVDFFKSTYKPVFRPSPLRPISHSTLTPPMLQAIKAKAAERPHHHYPFPPPPPVVHGHHRPPYHQ